MSHFPFYITNWIIYFMIGYLILFLVKKTLDYLDN